MGIRKLLEIVSAFTKFGRPPETPLAVIQNGSRSNQNTIVGTLENISEKAAFYPVDSPSIIIIGEVVSLRSKLNWFEKNS